MKFSWKRQGEEGKDKFGGTITIDLPEGKKIEKNAILPEIKALIEKIEESAFLSKLSKEFGSVQKEMMK